MSKAEDIKGLFKTGLNCSQSLFVGFAEESGLDRDTAMRVASSFGGGMGRAGETCGAISGALMVIGMKFGNTDEKDNKAKAKVYEEAGKFMKEFKGRNDNAACRDLLGFQFGSEDAPKDPKEVFKVIQAKCPKYVQDATEILEDILKD